MPIVSFLTLLSVGCVFKEMDATDPTSDDTGPTAVTIVDPTLSNLTAGGCALAPSTLVVSFETPNPTIAVVEFGPTADYGYSSVPGVEAKTAHRIQVPGFPGGAEWHWRIRVDGVDGPYETADQTFTGAAAPATIPDFEVGVRVEGAYTPGFRLVPGLDIPDNFVTIINDDGDAVWWDIFESPYTASQARMNADGSGISYLLQDYTRETDIGKIVRKDWCGETVLEARAEWGHHDFFVMEDGSYAFVAADIREVGGTAIVGDAIVEVQPDGSNPTAVWSTWDHLEMNLPLTCEPEFYPQGCDWTHGNGVAYDASEDAYYYSAHTTSSVVRFARNGGGEGAGVTEWVAGEGIDATLTFADADAPWTHQHGFKPVGNDEYVVFDNGPGGTAPSEVRRVRIDAAAGTVSTVWNYDYGGTYTSQLLGDVQVLESGNYYIGWGSEAEITEVTPDQEVVWQAAFELGVALGFSNEVTQIGGEVP